QHTRVGFEDRAHQFDRGAQVRVVGDLHADVELTDAPVVVEYLADYLAVGNDYVRGVDVRERRAEERDALHYSLNPGDGDVFPDTERLGEDDREARDHVAEHTLGGERDAGTGHTEPGEERQQFHAKVLQCHDGEQQEA